MKRMAAAMLVALLCVGACGNGATSHLTFDFALTYCRDPATPVGVNVSSAINGILTITNLGTSTVSYGLPLWGEYGYRITDSSGTVVAERPGSANTLSIGDPPAGGIALDPGPNYQPVDLSSWNFDTGIYPPDDGGPTPFIAPGVYQVALLLLHGDETNPATITVCGTTFSTIYAECNAPCASDALTEQVWQTPTHCGPTLTCVP